MSAQSPERAFTSPLRVLVTGVAGFVGSTLAERLIELGCHVLGVDNFADFYSRSIKEANLARLRRSPAFEFIEADLSQVPLAEIKSWLARVDAVSHQAAQAGVRSSWGEQFAAYTNFNVLATQRLLEAARECPVQRFVYASSSSVYGNAKQFPLREDMAVHPVSPYGVTKLAAEHLCNLYWINYRVPTVSLRYFTVYGPRQRPDMAMHRFIAAILQDRPVVVYGDGTQSRNFTYVDDVVEANVQALIRPEAVGQVINVGGGSRVTVNEVIAMLEEIIGKRARVEYAPWQKGDVDRTEADTTRAEQLLGFRPRTPLREGLARQVEWVRQHLSLA